MKIVIMGGTGVLSTSITKMCIKEGYEVLHFNRGSTRKATEVTTIIGDRYRTNDLERILQYKPDIIIDMLCFNSHHAEMAVNVFAGKIEQYIYCSTSCVYTPRVGKEQITEDSPTCPNTDYGLGKMQAEKVFRDAAENKAFHLTIFRPGHIYGQEFCVSNLDLEGLHLLNRMLNNKPIVLCDNGKRYFQACHADNLGIAFAKSCALPAAYEEIFNIAGEEIMTWNEIYEIEKKILKSESKIVYKDASDVIKKDPVQFDFLNTYTRYDWIQSTEKLKTLVKGYRYRINFIDGVKSFISNNIQTIKGCNYMGIYDEIL